MLKRCRMKYSELYSFDPKEYNAIELNKINANIHLLKLFSKAIAGIVIRKKNKFKRIGDYSLDFYDDWWNQEIQSIELKDYNSLEDFAFPKIWKGVNIKQKIGPYLINGKIYKISQYNYSRFNIIPLNTFLTKHTIPQDIICELGCGWGRNLFRLKALKLKNRLEGYEFSKNGIRFANKINNHFSTNIKFDYLNLIEKNGKNDLVGKTVFTHYVMEQLKYHIPTVIENLLEAKPKQVIHFDPTVELYKNSFRDVTSKAYFNAADYQNNLLCVLRKFENLKKLKINDNFRLGYGGSANYEQCLIHWSPIS